VQSIAKSKVKKVIVSTTPDFSRKQIAVRKYDSKQSIKCVESENKS